ncbi:DUF3367 domain-containing protein [Aeromicrobium sp. S22]|uniref:DUF3367 domain-containing protein n=1 Tax=Aeromicrobium sp. S22 TaxID=2662029 RepID=UPI00129DF907|nr:DUF3367 domain-containing protein [Aeromicrobium sp. S22]MRK02101.1 DUF3367 domain-containing protein [Aeromicrobium sp. S22]
MTEVSTRRRFRLAAVCLVLTALAFVQQPGRMVADTKLDLIIDPGGFLARSLNLWDAEGFFGQVQNQAYGYLFPMGPFFWLGHAIELPAWAIQRMWWALLLCVAFLGMVALCRALGIRSLWVQVFAGLLFALSPRMLSVIGPSSIEVWPSAIAPWVLVPLVIGLKRGSPRRQAALSALAVACVGGVNAVATFAVIPLGAIWLLTSPRGPRRRALMLWWPPFVLLGTLWWLAPLFLLGSVSPPFLDFIESSSVTTSAATVLDALRGTTNWVPYISSTAVAGRELVTNASLILNGGVVMILGVIGLVIAPVRYRRFLVWGVLSGLVLVTLGHTGSVSGWWSGGFQTVLDGVLAPLRNTHKFDVVIRIPLVLGAAFAVSAAIERRQDDTDGARRVGVAVLVAAAVVGATSPAWTGHLANRGTFEVTPTYWEQAADFLDENATGTSLLVPSSGFGDYLWGSTGDELMQSIARSPWAVRNSIPLTPTGTIRYLDSITSALDQARGSRRLAETLGRAGVEYLVVRNDLQNQVVDGRTELVYSTLRDTPGLTQVATFGPRLGGKPVIDLESQRSFSQGGWQSAHPAIDIWKVDPTAATAPQSLDETPTVVGAADSLAVLDELGVTAGRSTVLAADQAADGPRGPLVVTDGLRRQEAAFGRVDTLRSASMTPDEPYSLDRKLHDYVQEGDARWTSVRELRGAAALSASSARSAANSLMGLDPGAQPWSAFDGDRRTAWTANTSEAWLRLDLRRVRDLGAVRIVADAAPGEKTSLEVDTEDGVVRREADGRTPVLIDVGEVGHLEIRGATADGRNLSIAEVSSPELRLSRPLVLPATPGEWGAADQVVLGVDAGARPSCVTVEGLDRCRAGEGRQSEDAVLVDREIPVSLKGDYDLKIKTRPLAGEAADELLQEGLPFTVQATSTVTDDVRASVARAVDGDLRTGWIADPGDTDPSLEVTWDSPRRLSSLTLRTASGLPASKVSSAILELGDGTLRRVALENGRGRFPAVRTDRLVVHLDSEKDATDFGADGFARRLPVGVSELTFNDRPAARPDRSTDPVVLPCGSGPTVVVDGEEHRTSVRTTAAAVAAGKSATARLCDDEGITLPAGTSRVTVRASDLYGAGQTILTRSGSTWSAGSSDRLVTTTQNANPGWAGSVDGESAEAVTVNGWQRGWIVPETGSSTVEETFTADVPYRSALVAGAVGVLALVAITLVPGRGSRRRMKPDADGAVAPWGPITFVAMVATVGLVAGTAGVACAAVGGAVAVALSERRMAVIAWIGGLLLVAVGCYVGWALTDQDVPVVSWRLPQLCAAASLGAVAAGVGWSRGRSAMPGTSTNR